MNSGTASYNPSHEGNTSSESPKETQEVPILTLNDGKKMPMVRLSPSPAPIPSSDSSPARLRHWHSAIPQGRSKRRTR